jgi:cytochrome oxidase Cu insertion factor (SCO1/SenC/PrrC family)
MTTKTNNRWTLYAVFGVTVVPLMFAMLMYFNLWGVPDGRTNFGQLLLPPNELEQAQLVDQETMPWSQVETDKRWLVVYLTDGGCAQSCQEATHLLRQINVALGKEAHRVTRLLVNQKDGFNEQLQISYPALIQLKSLSVEVFEKGEGVYFVDPLGNIMMYYGKDFVGKELLKDLKKLLRTSNIG